MAKSNFRIIPNKTDQRIVRFQLLLSNDESNRFNSLVKKQSLLGSVEVNKISCFLKLVELGEKKTSSSDLFAKNFLPDFKKKSNAS